MHPNKYLVDHSWKTISQMKPRHSNSQSFETLDILTHSLLKPWTNEPFDMWTEVFLKLWTNEPLTILTIVSLKPWTNEPLDYVVLRINQPLGTTAITDIWTPGILLLRNFTTLEFCNTHFFVHANNVDVISFYSAWYSIISAWSQLDLSSLSLISAWSQLDLS